MKTRILTEEHLPAFIFLIDLIANDDLSEEGDLYKDIAEFPTNPIHPRTIRRAFNLRENLKQGRIVHKDYNRPNREALNALSYFYADNRSSKFSVFERTNKDEIERYYKDNTPRKEIIDTVFNNRPSPARKLALLEEEVHELKRILVELEGGSLEYFVEDYVDMRIETLNERMGIEKTLEELKDFVESRLISSEKRLRRSAWFYRVFGGIGLIFLQTPQYEDLREYILESFVSEQELDQGEGIQDSGDDEDEDDDIF